ncbi:hypothetical protein NP233_g11661 [Leucocoprinus birnbaumii]|uniref:Uncharacterized protein n=1 Tax=Leucocoprinus birnbaumii TaxID=56174 RepID=A0AAD5VG49_9AGAR|nr:hypothetical protein NP233_g11661 [Leucocoprinus birnbaumii]
MADLFTTHLTRVTHSPSEFTARCNEMYRAEEYDEFIRCALTGEYKDEDGFSHQAFIDLNKNYLLDDDDLCIHRDYDSALGFSQEILVNGPLSVCSVPHTGCELADNIHLEYPGLGDGNSVPYHKIPNFQLGTYGPRCSINVFFPELWSKERGHGSRPHILTQRERDLWYRQGFRRAIRALGTDLIASEFPATLETETERGRKRNGHIAWGTKIVDKRYLPLLADQIRHEISSNGDLRIWLIHRSCDGYYYYYYHFLFRFEAEVQLLLLVSSTTFEL